MSTPAKLNLMRCLCSKFPIIGVFLSFLLQTSATAISGDRIVEAWLDGNSEGVLLALQEVEIPESKGKGPHLPDILLLNSAVLHLYLDKPQKAQEILGPLLKAWPNWIEALRLDARVQAALHPTKSLNAYLTLFEHSKSFGPDYFNAAPHFMKAGNLDMGLEYYEKAVKEDKDLYYGWLGLGDAQLASGDSDDAQKSWQEAFEIHRGSDVAYRLNRKYWGTEEIQNLAPDKPRPETQLPSNASPTLRPGEVLRYKVKYLMFHLGTLVVENLGRMKHQDIWVHRIRFTVKSAGLGSLLHIDSEFESWIAEKGVYTLRQRNLQSDSASGDGASQFEMNLKKGVCLIRTINGPYINFKEILLPSRPQDGVSVFQLAREMARRRENASSLTMVDGAWKGTTFTAGKESTLRWNGQKRKVIRVDAYAHYKGPGGLSGRIRGWFSDDERAIPYKSKMKILLGSVVFRLQSDSVLDPPSP